jgi:hypothetical protein
MLRRSKPLPFTPLLALALALGVTALLWVTRAGPVTIEAASCAFVLLLLPCYSFLQRNSEKRGGLPVFAIIAFVYWWYFAIGLFWLDRTMLTGHGIIGTDEKAVTRAMWLALIGVVCMWAGMKVRIPFLAPPHQPELKDRPESWVYVRSILVMGTLASLVPGITSVLGAGGRQIIEILISTVPTVALLLFLRRYLDGKGTTLDKVILGVFFTLRLVGGLASGWLGSALILGLVGGAMYVVARRRVPWMLIAASLAVMLFLQVGKNEFRAQYWYGGQGGGILERLTFWVDKSAAQWSEAMKSGSGGNVRELAARSLERTSLLTQVAHVLELTPEQIPFLEGSSYSYLAITFIPRFVWPEKPSFNEANRYYQVAFGLTDVRNLDKVSIAVGSLAEAYINFGWPGAIGIMFGIGVLLGFYERTFVAGNSSALFLSVGIALLPGFLGIEAQMAQYLAGVLQTVLLTILVFFPVIRMRERRDAAWRERPLAPVRPLRANR